MLQSLFLLEAKTSFVIASDVFGLIVVENDQHW